MHITNISEAKASLSQLIKTVQTSKEPIIIGKAGKPVAVLSAFIQNETPRQLTGSWKGKVEINDSFDETIDSADEFVDSFYRSTLFPE